MTISRLRIGLGVAVFVLALSSAAAQIMFFDDFQRTGALTGTQPTVTTGGALWTQGGTDTTDTTVTTNGSAVVFASSSNKEPSLAFSLPADTLTTLSARFTVTSGGYISNAFTGYLAVGFINDSAPTPGIFSSSGPMIALSSDGYIYTHAAFTGSSATDSNVYNFGTASNVELKIIYDSTNATNIVATFLANDTVLGTSSFGSSGVTTDHVFLRSYLSGAGTVDDFTLTVPEPPTYAALISCCGLAVWARRRKGMARSTAGLCPNRLGDTKL